MLKDLQMSCSLSGGAYSCVTRCHVSQWVDPLSADPVVAEPRRGTKIHGDAVRTSALVLDFRYLSYYVCSTFDQALMTMKRAVVLIFMSRAYLRIAGTPADLDPSSIGARDYMSVSRSAWQLCRRWPVRRRLTSRYAAA